jgi:hypothetical protein
LIGSCASAPVVYADTDDICTTATTLTINGSGFLPGTATNAVAFTPSGTAGTVAYVNSHRLDITGITGLSVGALYAKVTNANGISNLAQVATVEPAPTITPSTSDVSQATGPFTFHGAGFVPGATSVTMSSGSFTITSVSPTSITVNFTVAPSLGALFASVTTACGTDMQEVANIVSGGGGGVVTLVGHWPLNEGSGPVALDSTVNANNLTRSSGSGDPVWDADTPGSQAGSGGCVIVLDNLQSSAGAGLPYGASDVSVSFWFRNAGTGGVDLDYGASPFASYIRGTAASPFGGATYTQNSNTINGASGGTDTNWHLYTMTWSGGNVWAYYEDGVLVGSGTAGFSINTPGPSLSTVHLGGDAGCKVKDLRIYSGVLTPTDVANIFAGSPP